MSASVVPPPGRTKRGEPVVSVMSSPGFYIPSHPPPYDAHLDDEEREIVLTAKPVRRRRWWRFW